MANEVRVLVEDLISAYPEGAQIPIDDVEEALRASGKNIDRADIYNALKEIQNTTNAGVLVLGRRQKPTRFCKGYIRTTQKLDETAMNTLKTEMSNIQKGNEMPLDKVETIFGDRSKAIEALRVMENDGLGVFLIGRRGGSSRFVVGVCRDELTAKSKAVIIPARKHPEPKDGPFADPPTAVANGVAPVMPNLKFQRVGSVLFKTPIGGSDTIEEVLAMYGYNGDKTDYIKESLELYGHFNMANLDDGNNVSSNIDKSNVENEDGAGAEDMNNDHDHAC